MESDEALMVRVQAGDDDALALLMGRWQAPLYGFLNRRAGATAADDLFQESWIRVVRARERFDPRRRFSTWLFQIANNLCRDLARRRAVDRRRLEGAREEAALDGSASPPAPVALRLDLAQRLAALPDRLREVLVLRYYHDLGEREIAEVLDIPRGTVKSRLFAAVRALREAEEEEEDADGPA